MLVVTGAAATGKSTIGDHLRGRSGLVVIDGDVLGRGAAATSYGRRDYVGFWRYALAVCREVRTNGLVPVVPCICLPDQVIAAVEDEVVHFLALVSAPDTVRRRIAGRRGVSPVPSPESHACGRRPPTARGRGGARTAHLDDVRRDRGRRTTNARGWRGLGRAAHDLTRARAADVALE